MQRRRSSVVLVLTLCALTALGSAQEPPAGTARARAVERLRPGSQVRIVTDTGSVEQGRLVRAGTAEVVLREGAAESAIPVIRMDSLWVARRSTGRGALIGALAGGAAGAIAGAVACADCEDTPPEAVTIGGAAVGAALGAGLGALLGAAGVHWARLYPD